MKYISLFLATIISFNSFAQCPKPVQYVEKGNTVNCTGFLFSPEKELELRIKNEEYKLLMEQTNLYIQQLEFYKKEVETREKIIKIQEDKVELWKNSADNYSTKYLELKDKQQREEYYLFASGIGVTLMTALALSQLTK